MGEPVGPEARWPGLVWEFHALADRYGRRTVAYEVGAEHLPLFLDLGLLPFKLGETARVPLPGFSLEGKKKADLRHAQRRATREGARFGILAPEAVSAVLDELEAVSKGWLSEHQAREKRFSLGYFDRDYLRTCSVGIVRVGERIVAFANLWQSADHEEVSVDLMRFAPNAPYGTMDFLFTELMLWAKAEGYRWLGLGMAPLSGLPDHQLAPLWSRLGRFMFRHGAQFYNFQGLRAYKEKFGPVWTPVYLLCPPRTLTRVLPEVTTLVAGGWGGVLRQ
jgi:phosphatidylglycerol lysyltransferase